MRAIVRVMVFGSYFQTQFQLHAPRHLKSSPQLLRSLLPPPPRITPLRVRALVSRDGWQDARILPLTTSPPSGNRDGVIDLEEEISRLVSNFCQVSGFRIDGYLRRQWVLGGKALRSRPRLALSAFINGRPNRRWSTAPMPAFSSAASILPFR